MFVDGLPVAGCWVADGRANGTGLSTVLIVRQMAGGRFVFGCFQIDQWGMGVKDCFGRLVASRRE